MNELSNPKQVICTCSGTTYQQITTLIMEGVDNLLRISQITGACSGCGGCESLIVDLLANNAIKTPNYP